jgi:hypothetical protein
MTATSLPRPGAALRQTELEKRLTEARLRSVLATIHFHGPKIVCERHLDGDVTSQSPGQHVPHPTNLRGRVDRSELSARWRQKESSWRAYAPFNGMAHPVQNEASPFSIGFRSSNWSPLIPRREDC